MSDRLDIDAVVSVLRTRGLSVGVDYTGGGCYVVVVNDAVSLGPCYSAEAGVYGESSLYGCWGDCYVGPVEDAENLPDPEDYVNLLRPVSVEDVVTMIAEKVSA